jgi:hypothetical protein
LDVANTEGVIAFCLPRSRTADCGLPAASAGGEPTSHPITLQSGNK